MELISVIKKPIYTEKSTILENVSDSKKYAFLVHPNANKILVKQAFKLIYNVEPIKVNIVVRQATKTKTGTMHPGVKKMKKIAIITIPVGVNIVLTGSKDENESKKGK